MNCTASPCTRQVYKPGASVLSTLPFLFTAFPLLPRLVFSEVSFPITFTQLFSAMKSIIALIATAAALVAASPIAYNGGVEAQLEKRCDP